MRYFIGSSAPNRDFVITDTLERWRSSSSDPSNTINTSPTVPRPGNTGFKSGSGIPSNRVICFTPQPSNSSKMTEGIRVFEDVRSKIYAISKSMQIVMII